MTTAQPRPKRHVREKVPDDLRAFLSEVLILAKAGADETKTPSDDLLQCKCAYGGLCEEGGDTFGFVYFPAAPAQPNRSRPRWDFELTRAQLDLLPGGGLGSIPLWACSEPACRMRFWTSDSLCLDCDFPDRTQERLPEGPFASRRDWALAFFALNPKATPFAMIGAYNGHTDWGEALGHFSFEESQAVHEEHAARPRS